MYFQPSGILASDRLPKNGHEFIRTWRNLPRLADDRYNLLLRLGDKVGHIFRNDISCGLLGELLLALTNHYRDEDFENIIAILLALSEANRFKLAVDFLDSQEKAAGQQLFGRLTQTWKTQDRKLDEIQFHSLQAAYEMC